MVRRAQGHHASNVYHRQHSGVKGAKHAQVLRELATGYRVLVRCLGPSSSSLALSDDRAACVVLYVPKSTQRRAPRLVNLRIGTFIRIANGFRGRELLVVNSTSTVLYARG